MDPRLHVAACNGDVGALQELLQEDPLVLYKAIMSTSSDSPLHIAALLGHTNFAERVMSLNRELSRDLNQQGFTPIHLASLKGHLQIVTELLNFDEGLCFLRDSEGRTPLHCAAIKGRLDVITHLMCPKSAMEVTDKGETLLHLAVNNGQKEALVLLISSLRKLKLLDKLIGSVDRDGKTALQLAIARNQKQMTKILSRETENGHKITGIHETNQDAKIDIVADGDDLSWKDKLVSLHNAIIVLCSLLATCCFDAIISPPGGVWQTRPSNDVIHTENIKNVTAHAKNWMDSSVTSVISTVFPGKRKNNTLTGLLAPNKAMSMALQPNDFFVFLFFDATCFIASLATINLMTLAVCRRKKVKYALAAVVMLETALFSAFFLYVSIIHLTSYAGAFVGVIGLVVILISCAIIFFSKH